MPRKGKEKRDTEHSATTMLQSALEQKLLENIVELQKIHTHLVEKFDKLSEQLAGLLGLFEVAARSFSEHPANQVAEKDKEFLDKVDKLLEQNKTIARGLTLVEERIRERMYGTSRSSRPSEAEEERLPENIYQPPNTNKPLPRF